MTEPALPALWHRPSTDDTQSLRRAFGAFATGVTVVATRLPNGESRAFTANSFSSVSMDPPLVLVCLGKFSASLDLFAAAEAFSVSILEQGQRELSNGFAARDPAIKIATSARLAQHADAPFVADSLASFICSRHEVVDAGDHVILIGRIESYRTQEGQPLGFFRGGYVGLGPDLQALDNLGAQVRVGGVLGHGGKVLLWRRGAADAWEIPSATLRRGERHGHALARIFSTLGGIEVSMSVPYSLFQETGETELSLIFSMECPFELPLGRLADGSEIALFGVEDAPWTLLSGEMKRSLVQRYLREMRSGLYGVYFDTLDGGSVVALDGRPRDWSEWDGRPSVPETSHTPSS